MASTATNKPPSAMATGVARRGRRRVTPEGDRGSDVMLALGGRCRERLFDRSYTGHDVVYDLLKRSIRAVYNDRVRGSNERTHRTARVAPVPLPDVLFHAGQ